MKILSLLLSLSLITNVALGASEKDLPITELKDMATNSFGGSDLINTLGFASKFTMKKTLSIKSSIGLLEAQQQNEQNPYSKEEKLIQMYIDYPVFLKTKTCTIFGDKAVLMKSKLRVGRDYTLSSINGSQTVVNMILFSTYSFPQIINVTCKMSPQTTIRQLEKALSDTFDISI